jgi:hypothetical protein
MPPKPEIGNSPVRAVPTRENTTDYQRADRSTAFALEDLRFGRLAQWAELISPKQFQRALHEQKRMADARQSVSDIASLLLKEKLLDREQVRSIHSARLGVPNGKGDLEFAAAAQRMGALTPNQLEVCRRIQMQALQDGNDPLPLPLVVHEKRFMQENQIIALLKGGQLQGWGLLHRINVGPEAPSERASLTAFLGSPRSRQRYVRIAGLAVVIGFLGLLSVRVASGPVATAHVQCIECRAIGGAPANSKWPTKCTECGELACYPMAICLECATRFPVKGIGYGLACPKCRSVKYEMLTNQTDVAAIDAAIDLKKQGPGSGAH